MSDSKLANAIKDKLSIKCVNDSGVMELMRGIRGQLDGLLTSVGDDNLRAMRLGLSHSLSRYKLKFSADKVKGKGLVVLGWWLVLFGGGTCSGFPKVVLLEAMVVVAVSHSVRQLSVDAGWWCLYFWWFCLWWWWSCSVLDHVPCTRVVARPSKPPALPDWYPFVFVAMLLCVPGGHDDRAGDRPP